MPPLPFACDATLPTELRYQSQKFRKVARVIPKFHRLSHDEMVELGSFMSTPGFRPEHFRVLFQWHSWSSWERAETFKVLADPRMIDANLRALDNDEGKAILKAIRETSPRYRGTVPLWCERYLQSERDKGRHADGLAQEWGVKTPVILKWWQQHLYDPLSGQSQVQMRKAFRPLGV